MSIDKIRNIGLDKLVTQVYDFDSLTTDELMCKFAQKINIIIEHLNYIDDRCYNSDKAMEEKLQYLLGQGLEEQVAKSLLESINNGTFGKLINETLLKDINDKVDNFKVEVNNFKVEVNEQLDNIDNQKANKNEVIEKGKATLNDFDEESRLAITGGDYNLNYVLGENNVKTENIADKQITVNKTNFITCSTQFIKEENSTLGYYYNRTDQSRAENSGCIIIEPFEIEKGVIYYYNDIYAYFSSVVYENGKIFNLSDDTTSVKSGSFTAEDDGKLYITINNTSGTNVFKNTAMVTNSSILPDEYKEGDYNIKIDELIDIDGKKIKEKSISIDKTDFVTSSFQFLYMDNIVQGKYYNHNSVVEVTGTNNYIVLPIRIAKGKEYYYKNIYGYFSTILYDDNTKSPITNDSSSNKNSGSFKAEQDGYIYITLASSINFQDYLLCPYFTDNSNFPDTFVEGQYNIEIKELTNIDGEGIKDKSISSKAIECFQEIEQLLKQENMTKGYYYNRNGDGTGVSSTACIFSPIQVKKGEIYYYKNIYGYFSYIRYDDDSIKTLSDITSGYNKGSIEIEQNGAMYITAHLSNSSLVAIPMLSESKLISEFSNGEGLLGITIKNFYEDSEKIKTNIIEVKKDGTGNFITITEAVNSVKNSKITNQFEIHIYDGIYDLLEEQGGVDWINSITDGSEMQGLLLPDFVHLIGHGSVYIDLIVPDETSTNASSRRISTINTEKSNRLEGITFRARNTRYVIHDEANNSENNKNLTRIIKNCRFIHQGNKEGNWGAYKAMGGGTSSGGRYEIINSHFESPYIPFTYHNNNNQGTNYMVIDGCTFSGNISSNNYDIGFGYYQKNTEPFYITVKNCVTDKEIVKYQEDPSTENDDVLELTLINNIKR